MDQSLFKKHILQIQKIKDSKEEVCLLIQEVTGVLLEQEEITISKTNITIQTSSVKKSILSQKRIKELLKEKGYELKF
jgi:hypothetical protein